LPDAVARQTQSQIHSARLTEPGFLIMMLPFIMGQYQTGLFHLSSQTKDHSGSDRTLLGYRMQYGMEQSCNLQSFPMLLLHNARGFLSR
jgi:hypothetical protein